MNIEAICSIFFKIAFVASVLIFIFLVSKVVWFHAVTLKKWKQAKGVIVESEMEWYQSETDNETQGWKETVLYRYVVNSKEYENDCLTKNFHILTPSKSFARDYKYRKFQDVIVHYNPVDPQQSILVTKINWFNMIVPLLILLVIYFFAFKNNVA